MIKSTIFAHCSGKGKAGVSVFRISGEKSIDALEQLMQNKIEQQNMKARSMYLRKLYMPSDGNLIDHAMVVYFQQGFSFTGEKSVEIHAHGSLAVIKMLNRALLEIKGVRLAEPGEFARRAFLNGKFDLTEAEGLADLIEAETDFQHKQAIRQMGGELKKIYDKWRQQLLKIMSLIEAYIDFPDEDIPHKVLNETDQQINLLKDEIITHLNDKNRGQRLRDGIKMAIIGKPNVGKSSLLNYFMGKEMAIVSEIAGTTRDVIEGHLDIGGYPIIIHDTAGIHEQTTDIIEKEGIKRAKEICADADIKIIMLDASKNDHLEIDNNKAILPDIYSADNSILVINKIDLISTSLPKHNQEMNLVYLSVKNKMGLLELTDQIVKKAEQIAGFSDSPQITRERHRIYLASALEYLDKISFDNELVLIAEDLRIAIKSLEEITGQITVDNILEEIFSNFCIGK